MIASEIMTENPRIVRPSDPLGQALDALQMMEVRHLPVVDDDDNLVGMLSDRDVGSLVRISRQSAEGEGDALTDRPVAEYMSGDVVTVEPDTDVTEVIEAMLGHRIGAVPVVDPEGTVVGIISYVDVLRAVADRLGADEDLGTLAGARRSRPGAT